MCVCSELSVGQFDPLYLANGLADLSASWTVLFVLVSSVINCNQCNFRLQIIFNDLPNFQQVMSLVSMGSTTPTPFTLEKFGGDDFHLFSVKMKMALIAADLWAVVNGDETRPSGSDAAVAKAQQAWDQKSQKGLAIIALSLKDNILMSLGIAGMRSGAEAWSKLQATYAQQSTTTKLFYRQRFAQLRMEEGEDVLLFVNRVTATVDEMKAAGVSVDEEDVVVKLLLGLPRSWSALVTALETVDSKQLTRDFVVSRLLHERVKQRELGAGHESALLAVRPAAAAPWSGQQRKKQQQHGKPKAEFKGECYNCGKQGHVMRDCKSKKATDSGRAAQPAQAAGGGAARSQAHTAQQAGPAQESTTFLFVASEVKTSPSEWLVDSGASEHMTCDASLFTSYERIVPRDVVVGNGGEIKAVGKGSVDLMLQVGGREHKATLTDVLHVPDLSANLFSVSRATERGYKAVFAEDGCRFETAGGITGSGCAQRQHVPAGLQGVQARAGAGGSGKQQAEHSAALAPATGPHCACGCRDAAS